MAVRVLYWVSKFPKAAKELVTAITSDKVFSVCQLLLSDELSKPGAHELPNVAKERQTSIDVVCTLTP